MYVAGLYSEIAQSCGTSLDDPTNEIILVFRYSKGSLSRYSAIVYMKDVADELGYR